ncbi:MAG: type II toxin-antitoxin system YafQ family toxin [Candidatus Thiodiazotropha taylori]|nr:type II toxin-antitoxin system YafQ family toxin [Candidatus Thiodiazotropha taylori]MCW4306556.1 type II toxin-antitoxin system YafQ family toxin [Candidatus Thiodiazotropha taylori]
MLDAVTTKRFERDYKKVRKQGKDMSKIKHLIFLLAHQEKLAKIYFDHPLSGNYRYCRECHIEPDWLLIYQVKGNDLILMRTGSHSDLFR